MSTPRPQVSRTPKKLDLAALEMMSEPMAVRVEKIRGSIRTPIPLPPGEDGGEQGQNWSKADVRGIEQWLVNEWTGGGAYEISVIDSSQPTPQKLEWGSFFPPSDFPEKIPPSLADGAAPGRVPLKVVPVASPPPTPVQVQQQVTPMVNFPSAFPSGFPVGVGATPTPINAPAPQQYFMPQAPAPQYNQNYNAQLNAEIERRQLQQAADVERKAQQAATEANAKALQDQLKEMAAQLQQSKQDQLVAQHKQELARREAELKLEQASSNDRMSKLEQLMAQLITSASAKPTGPDPALEALKEQNRILAEKAEHERREREADRREREVKDQMAAQQLAVREQIAAQQAAMERQIRESAENARREREASEKQFALLQEQLRQAAVPKGPDPIFQMMQENMRAQAEATRESARIQAEAAKEQTRMQTEASKEQARAQQSQLAELKGFMMSPRDMMSLAKESSQGVDQATRQITNTYQDILQMQRAVVEQVMQMQQPAGGGETAALIEKGLERASSFAERFIGGKTKEAVAQQQSQAAMAQAQAQAMTAQAMALQAQQRAQAGSQQSNQQSSGLNGHNPGSPAVTAAPIPQQQTPAQGANQTQQVKTPLAKPEEWTTGPVAAVPAAAISNAPKRMGRTDEQWFTQALPRVIELREGVALFMKNIAAVPPVLNPETGEVDGIEPEQAAKFVIQAVGVLNAQKIAIPAMVDLFGQGRIAEFLDVLLPDAPQPYRDEVAQTIFAIVKGEHDDDNDDDEEDEDDAPTPPPSNSNTNGRRAVAS